MTRTPLTPLHVLSNLRTRIPAGLTRKTVAYAGAGLALAGVTGATAAAGFGGHPAAASPAQQSAISGASHHVATAAVGHNTAKDTATGHSDAAKTPAEKAPAKKAPAKNSAGQHAAPAKHTVKPGTKDGAPAKHAEPAKNSSANGANKNHERTWAAVKKIVAKRTYPQPGHGALPAHDQLTPVGTSGPQTWLPISQARWDNAKTIVHEALKRHMGLRAAVIAVATSMQESTLLNLNYGDRDSLGLFQQRPSCGWGSASQIEHPAYAAGAFLNALHDYQASNPGWAHEPLWQAAQRVQGSAFPSAYAKWESQAAHLVASVTKHLV
jgi:hypothetical protein